MVNDKEHQVFLKTLFSFHTNKGLGENFNYKIFVGQSHSTACFFANNNFILSENSILTDDDCISLKKSIRGLNESLVQRVE